MSTITALGIGSGLDLNGLLDQLRSAERQQLQPIVAQQQSYQSKISAYGKLESALARFQDAADALNETSLFGKVTTSVDGEAVKAAASGDAAIGAYDIQVSERARAYSIATAGIADKEADLGAADINIDLANGETLTASVTAGDSTLEDIRDAINEQDGGVRASIVSDGSASPYRLVLSSAATGTEAAISATDFGALAGTLSLDAGTEVAARDAALTVNGIDISSQGNQVEGAIEGLTLTLEDTGSVTVEVERNRQLVKDGVSGLVSAYNNLQKNISTLTSYNAETGISGELLGDATLRNIETRMRNLLGATVGEGSLRTLSAIGVNLQLDGSLKLDEESLDTAVSEDLQGLTQFLAGEDEEGGMAGQLNSAIAAMLADNGALDNATSGLESSMESLDQRYERMERNIESTVSRYRTQFGRLDSMIASMNSTSDYLAQQFDMMNAQLDRK